MIGLRNELLNRLYLIVSCQSFLQLHQFERIGLKGVVTKAVFSNRRTRWYPYCGFFEGVHSQSRSRSTKRPPREAVLLLAIALP
jgi:hypothetical protein